jgi:hypothetical protein
MLRKNIKMINMAKNNENIGEFKIGNKYIVRNVKIEDGSLISFNIIRIKDNKKGKVKYELNRKLPENGIVYCDYKEDYDEDIYEAIHDFADKYTQYAEKVKIKDTSK